MYMPIGTHLVVTIFVIGFVLLGVGFSFRNRDWGLALVWIGGLIMLGPIVYKLLFMF